VRSRVASSRGKEGRGPGSEVDRRGFLLFRAGTIPGATVVTEDQFVPRTRYGLQLIAATGLSDEEILSGRLLVICK